METTIGGLVLKPRDPRNFKLGAITELPKLSELPKAFQLKGYRIKDQKRTDFCSAFTFCGMSELQEGVELSPEYSFALSKELSGDPESFGQDLVTAAKAHTKIGAIEKKDNPFSVDNQNSTFLRYITNYPAELREKATLHIKKSFFEVTGPYDHFDNIRATIWKYRGEKRAVGSGFVFGWDRTQEKLDDIKLDGEGHAMPYVGWADDNYLICAQSSGKKAGKDGFHLVSRKVVNHSVGLFQAFMFLDMDPETVKWMLDHGIKDRDNWVIQLQKMLITVLSDYLSFLVKKKKT